VELSFGFSASEVSCKSIQDNRTRPELAGFFFTMKRQNKGPSASLTALRHCDDASLEGTAAQPNLKRRYQSS
jgi:hypothetical protein